MGTSIVLPPHSPALSDCDVSAIYFDVQPTVKRWHLSDNCRTGFCAKDSLHLKGGSHGRNPRV